ncbi:alpha/beta hydrolase [Sediminibacter sp. Hel_I_10]|uniref:alpha/beta hydrolase n=1 Tax=Sediminibacter sp. Hel_I_10 TaxID=1392490 RepID=UPI0004797C14|nr:carboxylesterase family protein [Sediminibacter sp. Hel_I_10]
MTLKIIIALSLMSSILYAQDMKTYTYAIKGLDTLKMDVYTPKKIKKNDSLPVILWMHGGGFAGGSRANGDEVKLMKYASEKGYIGISISYRLLRKGTATGFGCDCPKKDKLYTFANAAIDYLDAAKFVFENSNLIQADTTKIIAGGSSAGAEGMLNAVYMKEYFIEDVSRYKNVKFAGTVALAGAVVDANYINNLNAIPTVLFHGTDDNLVPFSVSPHHLCSPEKPGYLILHGSEAIANQLSKLETAFYFHKVVGGRHELSSIPFDQLEVIFTFIDKTMLNSEIIQTKKTVFKTKP